MRFSQVVVSSLTTVAECDIAAERIEKDYQNCQGGIRAWNSGYEVHMLAGATNKLEAIQRKSDKIWHRMVKAEYTVFLKTNPAISFEEYEEHHVC